MVIMHGIVTALRWRSRVKRAWIQVSLAVGMVFVRLAASFTYLLGNSSIGNLSIGNGMELEPEECSRVYMDFIYNTHGTWWAMDRVFSNPDIVEKIVDDDNASNMRVVSRTGRDAVRDAVLKEIEEMLEYIYSNLFGVFGRLRRDLNSLRQMTNQLWDNLITFFPKNQQNLELTQLAMLTKT